MIWVTGREGMLGSELIEHFEKLNIPYKGTDKEVSITDQYIANIFAQEIKCSAIVNCAAYTDVDNAEINIQSAYSLNVIGAENLAIIAKRMGIPLIHFSTDYVFDGSSPTLYHENDEIAPLNVYGSTKALGELAIRRQWVGHFIIRTAWLYGKYGHNFVKTILQHAVNTKYIYVVNDQFGSPTHTKLLIQAVMNFLFRNVISYGTYHLTNQGRTSWYSFALKIQEISEKLGRWPERAEIYPINSEQGKRLARRPKEVILSKEKIKRELSFQIKPWDIELEEFLTEYF